MDQARATIDQIQQKVQTEQPDLLLGQCYRILGDNDQAEKAFRAAHDKNPGDPAATRALAAFLESTGRADQAVALLREALDADPSQRWAARRWPCSSPRTPTPGRRPGSSPSSPRGPTTSPRNA